MLPHKQLHFVYTIICVLLLISTIFHCYIHHQIHIPDEKINDKKDYKFYINKAQDGMIKGVLFGMILDGGIITAIRNGAIYGIFNPLISYIGIT
jgi:hypothetical protein